MDILNNSDKKQKLRASILKIREKYPDRIPIFVLKSKSDKLLPNINMNKFIVPSHITISELMTVIRKRITLKPETSLFLFINEKIIPPASETIGSLYDKYQNEDNLLLIYYCGENTFGSENHYHTTMICILVLLVLLVIVILLKYRCPEKFLDESSNLEIEDIVGKCMKYDNKMRFMLIGFTNSKVNDSIKYLIKNNLSDAYILYDEKSKVPKDEQLNYCFDMKKSRSDKDNEFTLVPEHSQDESLEIRNLTFTQTVRTARDTDKIVYYYITKRLETNLMPGEDDEEFLTVNEPPEFATELTPDITLPVTTTLSYGADNGLINQKFIAICYYCTSNDTNYNLGLETNPPLQNIGNDCLDYGRYIKYVSE